MFGQDPEENCVSSLKNIGPFVQQGMRICPPKTSTYGQAVRIVVSCMDRHPDLLNHAFQTLAHRALEEAWPCKD